MPEVIRSAMLGGTVGATEELPPSNSGSLIMRMLAFRSRAETTVAVSVNRGAAHALVERPQECVSRIAAATAAAAAVAPSACPSAAAPSCGPHALHRVNASAASSLAASPEPPVGAKGLVVDALPEPQCASAMEAVTTGAAVAAREPTGLGESGPAASPASPQLQRAPAPAGSCSYSTSVTADLVENAGTFGDAPIQDVIDTAASLPSDHQHLISHTQRVAEEVMLIPATQQTSLITLRRTDTPEQHSPDVAAAVADPEPAEAGANLSNRRLTPSERPAEAKEENDVCCTTVTADLERSDGGSEGGFGSGETATSQLAAAASVPTELPSACAAASTATAVPTEMANASARASMGALCGIRAIIDGELGASESNRCVVATYPIFTGGAGRLQPLACWRAQWLPCWWADLPAHLHDEV